MSNVEMPQDPSYRHLGAVNWIGLWTLTRKEVMRFLNVWGQSILAPLVTTLLFYMVFSVAFGGEGRMVGDVPFMTFLLPGLIMMSMAQNAFANTSSTLVIAKIQGNIVDVLMPPLSSAELMTGLLIGGVVRGLLVGLSCYIGLVFFISPSVHHIGIMLAFAFLGCSMMAVMGIMAGLWSRKFDHIGVITNFVVTPLTFLSGTFYSVERLPGIWYTLSHYNPFFYMVDGFRYGMVGHSDMDVSVGMAALLGLNILLLAMTYLLLRSGYNTKS